MLKVLKQKAEKQSRESAPRIDMALVLKDHKMSSCFPEIASEGKKGFTHLYPPPVSVSAASSSSTVAIPSSASSSCSIASKDVGAAEASCNDTGRPIHQIRRSGSIRGTQELKTKRVCTPLFHEMQESHAVSSNKSVVTTTTATEEAYSRPSKKQRLDEQQAQLLLLGRDDDLSHLKPLHAFIRQQIEVFEATQKELSQPAPGRKQPIKLGQVGIRCRHCQHLPVRDRVKRAVCYPSRVKKVYHSVSDMKFAHFTHCQELPPTVRTTFDALKEGAMSSSKEALQQKTVGKVKAGSTAKYYDQSALNMGMTDGPDGIFIAHKKPYQRSKIAVSRPEQQKTTVVCKPKEKTKQEQSSIPPKPSRPINLSTMTLASQDDEEFLNPIHCFVRKHTELFAADEFDVSAPAPGRKTPVVLGQVGLRCIHCASLPAKERVKRAVCYPPNVQNIYHAVSNMKFDHFGICPALPLQARKEFNALRTSDGSRRTRPSAKSTSDYYQRSALSKGLVDSDKGIRLSSKLENKNGTDSSPSIGLCGLSALALAACHAV